MASQTPVSPTPINPSSRTAFFYGTLMAPQVLHRVCHGGMDPSNPIYATHNLRIQPALLQHFRRHRVMEADYPAILPHADATVRGTLVTGLTDADIWRLDIFEGDEYQRQEVRVHVLPGDDDDAKSGEAEGRAEAKAETYVWVAGAQMLEEREWDFDEFRREKIGNWIGAGAEGEYAEVDEAVAGQGDRTGGRARSGPIGERLEVERDQKVQQALQSAV